MPGTLHALNKCLLSIRVISRWSLLLLLLIYEHISNYCADNTDSEQALKEELTHNLQGCIMRVQIVNNLSISNMFTIILTF